MRNPLCLTYVPGFTVRMAPKKEAAKKYVQLGYMPLAYEDTFGEKDPCIDLCKDDLPLEKLYRDFHGYRREQPCFVVPRVDGKIAIAMATLIGILPHNRQIGVRKANELALWWDMSYQMGEIELYYDGEENHSLISQETLMLMGIYEEAGGELVNVTGAMQEVMGGYHMMCEALTIYFAYYVRNSLVAMQEIARHASV